MTKRSQIQNDNCRILDFLYQYKHMTTDDIHYYLFPGSNIRAVERRIKHLLDSRLIGDRRKSQGKKGRSPKVYNLLLKGAREIGKENLGNQHYRFEQSNYHLFTLTLVELRHLSMTQNWRLLESEEESQNALYFFLTQSGLKDVSLMMPKKITPDLVLITSDGVPNICIRAHPLVAGGEFWSKRIARYAPILNKCRGIAMVLDEYQERDVKATLKRLGLETRVLVKDLEGLRKLPLLVNRMVQQSL